MIQYGRTAMRMQRQHSTTRAFLVLAMVLASLWAGGLAASAAGNAAGPAGRGRSLPGIEAAALRDRVPALRPPAERPSQSGRLVPLLLGMLAAALAVVFGVGAGRRRSGLAPGRSLVQRTQLEGLGPHPPSSRPDRRPAPCPHRRGLMLEVPDRCLVTSGGVLLPSCSLVGAAGWMVVTRPARLGLDLRGGTQIVLEAKDSPDRRVDGDTVARTLEVLRRRVDQLGVAEPTLQRSGERRVIVELPGVYDPEEAVEVIGRTAQLTLHPVLGLAEPAAEEPATTQPPAEQRRAGAGRRGRGPAAARPSRPDRGGGRRRPRRARRRRSRSAGRSRSSSRATAVAAGPS